MNDMNDWIRYTDDSRPPENTRILISDGVTITIAYFVVSDAHLNWFFENPGFKTIPIEWWMMLPSLPPRIAQVLASPTKIE